MSTRDITTAVESALDSPVVEPFFAIDMFFDEEVLRLWTGLGEADIEGNTYVGTGNLLDVSSVEETSDLSVRGATIILSGMPSQLVSIALQSPYQGRVCNIYFGVMDGNSYSNLTQVFSGYMDEMNISEGPEFSTIELKVENRLIDLERSRTRRYTSGYQKSLYPGDLGLDFVESLQDKRVVWGRGG